MLLFAVLLQPVSSSEAGSKCTAGSCCAQLLFESLRMALPLQHCLPQLAGGDAEKPPVHWGVAGRLCRGHVQGGRICKGDVQGVEDLQKGCAEATCRGKVQGDHPTSLNPMQGDHLTSLNPMHHLRVTWCISSAVVATGNSGLCSATSASTHPRDHTSIPVPHATPSKACTRLPLSYSQTYSCLSSWPAANQCSNAYIGQP